MKSNIIKIIIVFALWLNICTSYKCQTNGVIIPKAPQKFAIQTVVYFNKEVNAKENFNKYLDHYANLDCTLFDNIYIVWNNRQSPQQLGIKISQKWKKNIIFTKTPYNSLGWKYVIPESAPQKVFFAVDQNFLLNCDQLKKGFQNWKQNSIGEIGSLVSYTMKEMGFLQSQQKFTSQTKNPKKYFSISPMNCAFFSRSFTDLYYSDHQEIRRIRKTVQTSEICQDLAMNFIVSYFYPQIPPRLQQNTFNAQLAVAFQKTGVAAQQTASGVQAGVTKQKQTPSQSIRNGCMSQFIQHLSVNPLRYVRTQRTPIPRFDPGCIILKKQQYFKKMIKHKTPQQIFQYDSAFNPNITKQVAIQIEQKLKEKQGILKKRQENQSSLISHSGKRVIYVLLIVLIIGACIYNNKMQNNLHSNKGNEPYQLDRLTNNQKYQINLQQNQEVECIVPKHYHQNQNQHQIKDQHQPQNQHQHQDQKNKINMIPSDTIEREAKEEEEIKEEEEVKGDAKVRQPQSQSQ